MMKNGLVVRDMKKLLDTIMNEKYLTAKEKPRTSTHLLAGFIATIGETWERYTYPKGTVFEWEYKVKSIPKEDSEDIKNYSQGELFVSEEKDVKYTPATYTSSVKFSIEITSAEWVLTIERSTYETKNNKNHKLLYSEFSTLMDSVWTDIRKINPKNTRIRRTIFNTMRWIVEIEDNYGYPLLLQVTGGNNGKNTKKSNTK